MTEDLLALSFVILLIKGKLWPPDEFLISGSLAPCLLLFVHSCEYCFCEAHLSK